MPGKKGRSGKGSGGSGRNQGRPALTTGSQATTLAISASARQELRIITLHLRAARNNHALTQRQVVEQLIRAAWLDYEQQIDHAVSQAEGIL